MIRATSAALLLFLLACTGMVIWVGMAAHSLLVHLDGAAVRAQAIETKANATLINLDKGTAIWAASAKDQAGAVIDLATDVHGTLSEANTSIQAIRPAAAALTDEIGALHKTTDAATVGVQALSADLTHAQPAIDAASGLLAHATTAVDDLDAVLKDDAIHQTLSAAALTLDNANRILADGRKVADKAAADFLKPVPWWKQPIAKGGELIDIGAAIARHTP